MGRVLNRVHPGSDRSSVDEPALVPLAHTAGDSGVDFPILLSNKQNLIIPTHPECAPEVRALQYTHWPSERAELGTEGVHNKLASKKTWEARAACFAWAYGARRLVRHKEQVLVFRSKLVVARSPGVTEAIIYKLAVWTTIWGQCSSWYVSASPSSYNPEWLAPTLWVEVFSN